MHKTLVGVFSAAALAAATFAAPGAAEARCHGCGVAAGVIGGLAAGAIIGSAIANNPPPPPAAYVAPEPVYGPPCHIEHRRVWIEGYGWRVRRVEVCD